MDPESIRLRIAENLASIRERISRAAPGRRIKVVCVTKYAHDEWIEELLNLSESHLGENLLPKGAQKFSKLLSQGRRFSRHLIGPQQSRKVKLICGAFDWFQAIDRIKVAGLLHSELKEHAETINGLLQVNISGEDQKHGVRPEECPEVFAEIRERFSSIRLRGLMAVPAAPSAYGSFSEFEHHTRQGFALMKSLFDKIARLNPEAPRVDTLSMGMTQDFEWAVQEGATMVRIGSALYDGLEG